MNSIHWIQDLYFNFNTPKEKVIKNCNVMFNIFCSMHMDMYMALWEENSIYVYVCHKYVDKTTLIDINNL